MKTISELLRNDDPLNHEPTWSANERGEIRAAVLSASGINPQRVGWSRGFPVATFALIVILAASAAVGAGIWSHSMTGVQAAVHFEIRLAEDYWALGLREARVSGSGRTIFLHDEVVVTNGDIARAQVSPGGTPSTFNVDILFTAEGAEKMRRATQNHANRPMAILIDDTVVMTPTVRGVISDAAMINGDYTRAEAERIANGIDKH